MLAARVRASGHAACPCRHLPRDRVDRSPCRTRRHELRSDRPAGEQRRQRPPSNGLSHLCGGARPLARRDRPLGLGAAGAHRADRPAGEDWLAGAERRAWPERSPGCTGQLSLQLQPRSHTHRRLPRRQAAGRRRRRRLGARDDLDPARRRPDGKSPDRRQHLARRSAGGRANGRGVVPARSTPSAPIRH